MYIDNIDELKIRDCQISEQREARAKRRGDDDDDDDEKSEEGEGGEEPDSVFSFDRSSNKKGAAAAGGDDDDEEEEDKPKGKSGGLLGGILTENPNKKIVAPKQLKVKDLNGAPEPVDPEAGMNRKEREVIEAQRKKDEYIRRHLAGETAEAKKEIAMLAIVKARREEAAKKREAEGRKPGMSSTGLPSEDDESSSGDDDDDSDDDGKPKPVKAAKPAAVVKLSEVAAKKKAAAAGDAPVVGKETTGGSAGGKPGEPAKLKAMDIKKMNGDALKDHLRERGLDVQGQKKDLMTKLLAYEAARE